MTDHAHELDSKRGEEQVTPADHHDPASAAAAVDQFNEPDATHTKQHTPMKDDSAGQHATPFSVSSSSSSSSSVSSGDDHLDCCLICGDGGEVLMCDTCTCVYHLTCAKLRAIPDGLWSCDICKGQATVDEYRAQRQAARAAKRRRAAGGAHTNDPIDEDAHTVSHFTSPGLDADYGPICAFCRVRRPPLSSGFESFPSSDPRRHEEKFVGPFTDQRGDSVYAHHACAVWSPRVFIEDGRMMNVIVEVQRARWLNCAECGKRGASIGCCESTCSKSYHYPCAQSAQCTMRMPEYALYCPAHAIEINFNENHILDPQLRKLRLNNTRRVVSGVEPQPAHAPIDNPRRPINGHYSTADAYVTFLTREATKQKQSRFAHLAHLPYDDRKRAIRAELRIQSLADERRERARLSAPRKRPHALALGADVSADGAPHRGEADVAPAEVLAGAAVDWSMIGGLATQIESLKESVLLPMLYPELFTQMHIQPPRGMLLLGPPGTGKTLLARALAHACSSVGRPVSFFARKGADVLSRFHGDAELTLRTLFDVARRSAPSVIFFDEIDGLVPVRSAKQNQVHASVVTTLLSLMDGLTSAGQVFVLASTNRVDAIDPALRRPGRFDREIYVGLPNHHHRREILRIHTHEWPAHSQLAPIDIDQLAALTPGFSGADLRALCSESALLAAHRSVVPGLISPGSSAPARSAEILAQLSHVQVNMSDFRKAINKMTPSVRRQYQETSQQQYATQMASEAIITLMRNKLREAKYVLDLPINLFNDQDADSKTDLVPLDDDAPSSSSLPLTLPSSIHRLLICGGGPAPDSRSFIGDDGELDPHPCRISPHAHNPSLLASTLIATLDLDSCTIHRLDLPSLMMDEQALTLAEACVRKFQAVNANATNLFYLPRLDEWWCQTSIPSLHPLRAALITCLRQLNASLVGSRVGGSVAAIFVATTSCTRSNLQQMELHPFLQEFFRSNHTIAFHKPTNIAIKTFLKTIINDSTRNIAQYIAQCVPDKKSSSTSAASTADAAMGLADAVAAADPAAVGETHTADGAAPTEAASHVPMTDSIPLADVPTAPTAEVTSTPPPTSESTLVASFDAFTSSSSSALFDLVQSIVNSTPLTLDFATLQRVELGLQHWTHTQLELIRASMRPQSHSKLVEPFASFMHATVTLAPDESLPWIAIADLVANQCKTHLSQLSAEESQSKPTAAADPTWIQMARSHQAQPKMHTR